MWEVIRHRYTNFTARPLWTMEAKWFAQANKLWDKYYTKYLRREEKCIYTIYTHRTVFSYRSWERFLWLSQAAQIRISRRTVLRRRELSLRANPAENVPYENLVTNTIWHHCRNERFCLFLSQNQAHQQSRPVPALEALSSVGSKIVRPSISPNEPFTALGRDCECWEKRRRCWVQWEAPLSALGHFPVHVFQVSCWNLPYFPMSSPPNCPWNPCRQRRGGPKESSRPA